MRVLQGGNIRVITRRDNQKVLTSASTSPNFSFTVVYLGCCLLASYLRCARLSSTIPGCGDDVGDCACVCVCLSSWSAVCTSRNSEKISLTIFFLQSRPKQSYTFVCMRGYVLHCSLWVFKPVQWFSIPPLPRLLLFNSNASPPEYWTRTCLRRYNCFWMHSLPAWNLLKHHWLI